LNRHWDFAGWLIGWFVPAYATILIGRNQQLKQLAESEDWRTYLEAKTNIHLNKMKITVTGAFGYSGRYIAQRLLDAATKWPHDKLLQAAESVWRQVRAYSFHFDQPSRLTESLKAWMSSSTHTGFASTTGISPIRRRGQHEALFQAAKQAGVRRIVHISITSPDLNSDLPYFRGKAELELASKNSVYPLHPSPTVLFARRTS